MSHNENIVAGSPEDALVGTLFADGYEILSVLGKGGIGAVYKARYVPLDQLVAMKILQAHMVSSPNVVQRLRMEAKLAHSLEHRNIVRVLRLHISAEGFPFLVADLVEGRTIQQALASDGPFSDERFMRIFTQALDALEHAHKRGIVHRDIKPSNIMLEDQGEGGELVKIVDFGIAKLLEDSEVTGDGAQTSSGTISGSPSYMSPEQCTGTAIDARTDIYSLGCVMYEALTGTTAFSGDTAINTMFHQVNTMPRRFSEVAPHRQISAHWESAVFAALQKDPAHRPQTINDLRSLLTGDDTHAVQQTPRWTVRRRPHKSRLFAVIGGIAVAAAAAISLVALVHHHLTNGDTLATTGGDFQMSGKQGRAIDPQLFTSPISALNTGLRLAKNGQHDDAMAAYARANELLAKPGSITPLPLALNIKRGLAQSMSNRQQYAKAWPLRQEEVELAKRISKSEYGMSLYNLSYNSQLRHRDHDALNQALKSAQVLEQALQETTNLPNHRRRFHRNCSTAWRHLSTCYAALSRPKEAEQALRRAVAHDETDGHLP
jgi:tRNA A-37 threonylcarbamoyl transferase component Bud32/tetratricopeptide (TPR) repeat protein